MSSAQVLSSLKSILSSIYRTQTLPEFYLQNSNFRKPGHQKRNGSASNAAAIAGCILPTTFRRASNRLRIVVTTQPTNLNYRFNIFTSLNLFQTCFYLRVSPARFLRCLAANIDFFPHGHVFVNFRIFIVGNRLYITCSTSFQWIFIIFLKISFIIATKSICEFSRGCGWLFRSYVPFGRKLVANSVYHLQVRVSGRFFIFFKKYLLLQLRNLSTNFQKIVPSHSKVMPLLVGYRLYITCRYDFSVNFSNFFCYCYESCLQTFERLRPALPKLCYFWQENG